MSIVFFIFQKWHTERKMDSGNLSLSLCGKAAADGDN
jgi:hypothetical protein